jgi:hypothetical protein
MDGYPTSQELGFVARGNRAGSEIDLPLEVGEEVQSRGF